MSTRITLSHIAPSTFHVEDEAGNSIRLAGKDAEPPAVRPMHALLGALAACAAIGVERILVKQRQPFTALTFDVEGDREEEAPNAFVAIRVRVQVRGRGLDRAKVEHAVRLTEERYCSVYATLRRAVPITTTVAVEEEEAL